MAMKVPVSWLGDYVQPQMTVEQLAERLTLAGMEVESITRIGELWDRDKLFVGQLLEVTRHPDAERLVLARVEYGGPHPLTVVTGAPNLYQYVGQDLGTHGPKVAMALAGVRLVDGHSEGRNIVRLKPNKIRGIMSEGMVCSEKELDLSEEHEGNLILPDDAPVGTPLVDYLGDAVLEFDIKGALGHLQSVVGIAREVSALSGYPLDRSVLTVLERRPAELREETDFVGLQIDAPDLCPRYSAALIEGLTVGPSPYWMQQRLLRAGMRPISNVVDVTNYVMLELGQPLHAFDYDLLAARANGRPTIIMRRAKPGERMVTLDGVDRALDPDMLLITDTAGAVAVAGVMGGAATEVHPGTRRILLESANFHFLSIRRTSQMLRLPSEAAMRFGKQLDPDLTAAALARAGELLAQMAGGQIVPIIADLYPGRRPTRTIQLDTAYVGRLLGINVPVPEIVRVLRALEFEVSPVAEHPDALSEDGDPMGNTLNVRVPEHRQDVNIPADLVEEVARIYGYDRMPLTLLRDELPPQRRNLALEGETEVRRLMAGAGLEEIITYSIVNIAEESRLRADKVPVVQDDYIRVRNPLTADRAHLRRSLLPALLDTARSNLRFTDRVPIFEIGATFIPVPGELLPSEPRRLGALLIGPREPAGWQPRDTSSFNFYDMKGIVQMLVERLGVDDVNWARGEHPSLHPGRTAELRAGSTLLGHVGELHPVVREAFDLPAVPVVLADLDLEALLAAWPALHPIQDISGQPPVYEDLALIVDRAVSAAEITGIIRQAGGKTLTGLRLFDVYQGAQVPAGKKSLAYALTFQAPDRTLTDEDVKKTRSKIVARLEREFGATLRGG